MNEEFLQFLWKFQLFDVENLYCTTGEKVVPLHVGSHNTDAGPDFFNAKIQIGEEVWAGNVEIHQRTSDWVRHNHHKNKAYDNVILHVVAHDDDSTIHRTTGSLVKCAVMNFNSQLEERYREIQNSTDWVACEPHIKKVDEFVVKQLMGRLLVERLGKRVEAIQQELIRTSKNWEEVFYIFLLRTFGFSINALPFELLAKSLPYQLILKHRNRRMAVEALLFGQSGLLEKVVDDEYYRSLKAEYAFLRAKYKLKPLEGSLWKFLRTRPHNFPTIRIAQLAAVLCREVNLFSMIISCRNIQEFKRFFEDAEVSDYWISHFAFGSPSKGRSKWLGDSALNLLAINLWIPFVFAYGHFNDSFSLKERALDLLDTVSPDDNSLIDKWRELGMPTGSAFYTQALLHLKSEYCDLKKCLHCSIGKKIVEGAS